MTSKRKTPEFDIEDDTPTTSDGECTCIGQRNPSCPIKSHR